VGMHERENKYLTKEQLDGMVGRRFVCLDVDYVCVIC
jgi:hypothetical protein